MIKKLVKNFNDSVGVMQNSSFAKQLWVIVPIVLIAVLLTVLAYNHYTDFTWNSFFAGFNQEFLIFFGIGIFAQMVDGTLGMGYGATSTSFLLAYGVPPAISSTGVHVS
ncbi:MAG: hypothetical protein RL308_1576, partial [Bacteroidota bacterium]